ncbi:MAG: hypothetical protein U0573_13430 [Phycisphaerales bacterium]|nr:hypothetical protein [Planctomycetota bacterium]
MAGLSLGVALAASLVLSGCNTNKPADETVGVVDAQGATATATVQSINYQTREVTLLWQDGQLVTYKCGPEVRNFDQIHQGDQVNASVAEAVALWVGPASQAPTAEAGTAMLRAKKGEKPGVVLVNTFYISAKVLKVDSVARSVTLQGPAGNVRVLKVAPDVNLANVTVGNDVSVRATEAVALWVEKP